MTTTTHSLPRIERQLDASWPLALCGGATLALSLGLVGHPDRPWSWTLLLVCALIAAAAFSLWRIRRSVGSKLTLAAQIELASLALVPSALLTHQLAPIIELSALSCIALVLLAALLSPRAALASALIAVCLEWLGLAGALLSGAQDISWPQSLVRSGFLVCFASIARVVHGVELFERRQLHHHQVTQERERMWREAREFRLIHAGQRLQTSSPEDHARAEELVMRDAVEAVHHSTYVSLRLLKNALGCHTCVLLWFDVRHERLHIKELVSDSDHLYEGGLEPARGVLGGITRRREPVILSDLREGFRGLCYYQHAEPIKHFLGVPAIEDGHLRGVLCVDRVEDRAFSSRDVEMVEEACSYILRAIQNERLFAQVEQSKAELAKFFEATRQLNRVLTLQEAQRVALELVADAAPAELLALTSYDSTQDLHTIAALSGPLADQAWIGRSFRGEKSQHSLVSMVARNRHYLPYGGQVREQTPQLFTSKERVEGLKSLLVLPLVVQDQVIGTLVVGHREAQRYPAQRREVLEVVSTQVAITLQNATLYAKMEEMATRDALTGLANRRMFMTRMDEAIARHKRSGRTFAMVISDIDHFKSVNDTYGHPVGDEVLREVAKTFGRVVRETDLPARYGGEEFVIVLEETESEGALVITNRLREEISKLRFQTEKGELKVTISMGISLFPSHSQDRQKLIDLADQALYRSKKGGRNRVTLSEGE